MNTERPAEARAQARTARAWRQLADAVTVWHAPGNHMTLLTQPHVGVLAQWWNATVASVDTEKRAAADPVVPAWK